MAARTPWPRDVERTLGKFRRQIDNYEERLVRIERFVMDLLSIRARFQAGALPDLMGYRRPTAPPEPKVLVEHPLPPNVIRLRPPRAGA